MRRRRRHADGGLLREGNKLVKKLTNLLNLQISATNLTKFKFDSRPDLLLLLLRPRGCGGGGRGGRGVRHGGQVGGGDGTDGWRAVGHVRLGHLLVHDLRQNKWFLLTTRVSTVNRLTGYDGYRILTSSNQLGNFNHSYNRLRKIEKNWLFLKYFSIFSTNF